MKLFKDNHIFTGMQSDISISKHPENYLYDAQNIRINLNQEGNMLSIVNERGPLLSYISVNGNYLGHCLIGKYLVVFSTGDYDYITKIDLSKLKEDYTDTSAAKLRFKGILHFDTDHPIETLASYENENIQKVYWVDGKNQPRVVNIAENITIYSLEEEYTAFDFVRTLKLNEYVRVRKILGGGGLFPSGVIQYAITYYDKFGQETNIVHTTPLQYISFNDRGGSPEEKIDNSFEIFINNVDDSFQFVRIYSILRTSLNGTPICKRVQDIEIKKGQTSISFVDTGTIGDNIDPTELLYKGGEEIKAKTIQDKNGTLFLGNISISRPSLKSALTSIEQGIILNENSTRFIYPNSVTKGSYNYSNQLTSMLNDEPDKINIDKTYPCGGFKTGDYYRCGIQFQYKTGKWSEPIYIKDVDIKSRPSYNNLQEKLELPTIKATLKSSAVNTVMSLGYKRVRAVVVFPQLKDRCTVCQGIANRTLFTNTHKDINKDIQAQSSWFFRPYYGSSYSSDSEGAISPASSWQLPYTSNSQTNPYNPNNIRTVELEGQYDNDNKFQVGSHIMTLHSPDIEFDSSLTSFDYSSVKYRRIGTAVITNTLSNISIQTETPTASNNSSGVIVKSFNKNGAAGIVSGLFYEDYIIDDIGHSGNFGAWEAMKSPVKWMVYAWNSQGSLNNDINRPVGQGESTAKLKKKIISNLRYSDLNTYETYPTFTFSKKPQLFNSNQQTIVKLDDYIYLGNVDTLITPDDAEGKYFAFNGNSIRDTAITPFNAPIQWKTFSIDSTQSDKQGVWKYENNAWVRKDGSTGDAGYIDLIMKRGAIRMRYKSTPHLVVYNPEINGIEYTDKAELPIMEIIKTPTNIFGGESSDALQANTWIPCGESVRLEKDKDAIFEYSYGDTYYQRYDCLKTYAFSPEDQNQIVEIGSFMLETHINIDGRYDRNRGQLDNTMMSPTNFNLINHVYSQQDNFFSYKILDSSFYDINNFANQITWTKQKQNNAIIDNWTNISLASTIDLEGTKGEIVSLNLWQDQLMCFQKKGISTILFNSRVQIPTSDNVPIEISNSYKVDGYRYLTYDIGCTDKKIIKETPSGIYFIDSITNNLHILNKEISDISTTHNMVSWFRDNSIYKVLYDNINRNVYIVTNEESLCYSELLNEFMSRFSYSGIDILESYDQKLFLLKDYKDGNNATDIQTYIMNEGAYNNYLRKKTLQDDGTYIVTDDYHPWSISFRANGFQDKMTSLDKVFTNIEYRMDVYNGAGELINKSFKTIQVTNEYQDTGTKSLENIKNRPSNLKKKFRIWRIDIPRNIWKDSDNKGNRDRIRNTWCNITLTSDTEHNKAVLHDISVLYYI